MAAPARPRRRRPALRHGGPRFGQAAHFKSSSTSVNLKFIFADRPESSFPTSEVAALRLSQYWYFVTPRRRVTSHRDRQALTEAQTPAVPVLAGSLRLCSESLAVDRYFGPSAVALIRTLSHAMCKACSGGTAPGLNTVAFRGPWPGLVD